MLLKLKDDTVHAFQFPEEEFFGEECDKLIRSCRGLESVETQWVYFGQTLRLKLRFVHKEYFLEFRKGDWIVFFAENVLVVRPDTFRSLFAQ